jgi:hypothetical protein
MVSIAPPPSFVVLYALVYHTGPTLSIPQKEKNHMLWDFFPAKRLGKNMAMRKGTWFCEHQCYNEG